MLLTCIGILIGDTMILDRLEHAARYESLHPRFPTAFAFLRQESLDSLPPARYELEKADLYAIITNDRGKPAQQAKLEGHRKYIDIHYVIGGTEQIGWRGIDRCTTIDSPYNAGKDFLTFHDASESWSVLTPGTFAVYFPEDAHAPMVADGTVHKVVIKIAL